jgi:hemerythrin-like domain-containing protein
MTTLETVVLAAPPGAEGAAPKALSILHAEHRSILAVLHGMDYLVQGMRTLGRKVEPRVFHAMIYYLDTFSERMHHPKEDRYLFKAIRERSREAAALIDELEEEHARGAHALSRLAQALIRYEEGGEREFPAFEREVESFAHSYRDHIRKEEELLFPLARGALDATDWARLATAIGKDRDPLALGADTGDFDRIFNHILEIAPEPIGFAPRPT